MLAPSELGFQELEGVLVNYLIISSMATEVTQELGGQTGPDVAPLRSTHLCKRAPFSYSVFLRPPTQGLSPPQ